MKESKKLATVSQSYERISSGTFLWLTMYYLRVDVLVDWQVWKSVSWCRLVLSLDSSITYYTGLLHPNISRLLRHASQRLLSTNMHVSYALTGFNGEFSTYTYVTCIKLMHILQSHLDLSNFAVVQSQNWHKMSHWRSDHWLTVCTPANQCINCEDIWHSYCLVYLVDVSN